MELVNTHCHCVYSCDGTGSIAEYADAAAAAGLTTLAFTEHFPLSAAFDPDEYLSMRPQMVNAYLAEIDEARARHPQIEFVTGTEMDYLGALEDLPAHRGGPGPLPLPPSFGALHRRLGLRRSRSEGPLEGARGAGRHLAALRRAVVRGGIECEPALRRHEPSGSREEVRLLPEFQPGAPLRRDGRGGARRRPHGGGEHVGRLLRLHRNVPGPGAARRFCRAGVPCTVGCDSHDPANVARDIERAYGLMYEAGYRSVTVPTATGDRRSITIE